MKKYLLLGLLSLLFINCHKKEEKQLNPIDQLPPLTHTGANTAGCLVDGKIFLPENHPIPLNCDYYQQQYFGLDILTRISNTTHTVRIEVTANLHVGQTYRLTLENTVTGHEGNWGTYTIDATPSPSPLHFGTNNIQYGEITITHHDFSNATISGTFWFDAINSEDKIVHITDGRFDCKY